MNKSAHGSKRPLTLASSLSKLEAARESYTRIIKECAGKEAIVGNLKFEWNSTLAKGIALNGTKGAVVLETNRVKIANTSLLRRISGLEGELILLQADRDIARIDYEHALLIANHHLSEEGNK